MPSVLPRWPPGTVGLLATAGDAPHVIPVSTIVRAGDRRVLFALAHSRDSLARVQADPRVSLAILCPGVAISAEGAAEVLREQMQASDQVAALSLEAERICEHDQPTFAIDAGVRWRWTEGAAAARDEAMRAELERLAR